MSRLTSQQTAAVSLLALALVSVAATAALRGCSPGGTAPLGADTLSPTLPDTIVVAPAKTDSAKSRKGRKKSPKPEQKPSPRNYRDEHVSK